MNDYSQDTLFNDAQWRHEPVKDQGDKKKHPWGTYVAIALVSTCLATGISSAVAYNAAQTHSNLGVSSAVPRPVSLDASTVDGVAWSVVANNTRSSVVTIQVTNNTGGGEGTGIILDSSGRILTNNHVVAPAKLAGGAIKVILSDGRIYDATIVGTDGSTDLAVVQLTDPPASGDAGFVPAKFANSDEVSVGQPVMAVGNPLGLSDTVTTGIISATNRPVTSGPAPTGAVSTDSVITNALQTDAAINPGNSGGPLVNSDGQVIGINSSIATASQGAGSIGLGFAIPSNEAQRVSQEIIKNGTVKHARLGITLNTAIVQADGITRQGARVESVDTNSAAGEAGVKVNDYITAVNGVATPGADAITALIRSYSPNQKIELSVVRNGSIQNVSVTLGTLES